MRGAGLREAIVDAGDQRRAGVGGQLLAGRRAVRQDLDVDAGLVHLLDAQRAEIVQARVDVARPSRLDAGVGLGELLVPVVLLNGDDLTFRFLEHDVPCPAMRTVWYQRRTRLSLPPLPPSAAFVRIAWHNNERARSGGKSMHVFSLQQEQ